MGRILPLVAVIVSFVAFGARVDGSEHWWVYPVDRGSFVLAVLAVVAALLTARRANTLVLGAQLAAAATALGFMAVGAMRFYDVAVDPAYPWATEAQVLAVAALAWGLTLARRRSGVTIACLVAAIAVTLGCATYAITQRATYAGEVWWWLAIAGAFLAAAFAAAFERQSSVTSDASDAPAANVEPENDPVE